MVTGLMIAAAATGWAQRPPEGPGGEPPGGPMEQGGMQMPGRGGPQGGPMGENFFPPELIMQNQQALGLSDEQKTAIRDVMQKSMARFTDLQWQQSAEAEAMGTLLKQEPTDEGKAVAQLDKLLNIENEIKRLHMSVMIKVKNLLKADQQAKLRELRRPSRPEGGQQGPGRRQSGMQNRRGPDQSGGGRGGPQDHGEPPPPPER